MLNDDFREMLCALSEEGAEFLLVGAYALAVHGIPRATGDMDLWIRCSPQNAERTWRALARFGAPMERVTREELSTPGMILQVGVAPCRVDVLTSIDGVEFEEAWPRRSHVVLGEVDIPVISRQDLIRNKRATNRPQDRADLDALGDPGGDA